MRDIKEYMNKTKKERQKHLDLNEECVIRGGDSIQFRGLLAYYLDTNIPSGHFAICCHACNNPDCSNPKHLYWGTVADNREDFKLDKENYQRYIDSERKRVRGHKNPNYCIKPWKNSNGKLDNWKLAGEIYNNYVKNGWDFSAYGNGASFIQKQYNIPQGSSKVMIKMFRKGWNPWEDDEWLEFFGGVGK